MLNDIMGYFEFKLKSSSGNLNEETLYENFTDPRLKFCLAAFNKQFNDLLTFYNDKAGLNRHFNADQSRDLIELIKKFSDFKFGLNNSGQSIKLVESYEEALKIIEPSLSLSGGSIIPDEYQVLPILKYDPIFILDHQVELEENTMKSFSLKLINEGSYARVYKYYDDSYETAFALKRAKEKLTETELVRFKKEFDVMKTLDSPYIVKVYSYHKPKKEFIMEYVKYSLKEYISKNNSTLKIANRKSLRHQLFRALEYIHSKGIFHRDLSLGNVLVKVHDDNTSIIKVCDFGYLKDKNSSLTRQDTLFAGSLNDPELQRLGFDKYNLQHEIFALSQVIFYIMTGKHNLSSVKKPSIVKFLEFGMAGDLTKRAKTLQELKNKFSECEWE